jgi:MFS family permease
MSSLARRVLAPFYTSSFTWNLALGMTYLLIPLYARELGFSALTIGSLIALPVIVQMAFNLLGGAWTDRLGAMNISLGAFVSTAAAGAVFALSGSFAGLFAGQILMIMARAVYWPSSWSLASEIPGDRSKVMGWLNAVTSLGQIVGTVAAGMIIAAWGFGPGFWILAALGAVSFAIGLTYRYESPGRKTAPAPMLVTYRMLLRRRAVYFGIMCAYIAALPFSLSLSFYPILLVEQGHGPQAVGWLVGMRAIGSIAGGAALAGFVRTAEDRSVPLVSALLVAASVGLVAAFSDPLIVALFLLGVGLGSGVMTIYFQILVSSFSTREYRGSAMALAGMGWGISHFSTPILMGWLTDLFGIRAAFYTLGGLALLWSLALAPMQRWALR